MKQVIAVVFAALALGLLVSWPAQAVGLKVQPLLYEETLKKGEIKKGFIDVSNPTNQKLDLVTSVQAFRQVDDQGNLEFYDSEVVAAGITPDYEEFSLDPKQAIRMMFEVDGSKLPSGDVFAALFVTTADDQSKSSISQNVRVGTLLILENGTTPARQAEVTATRVPFFQFGSQINGTYTIRNTADPNKASGFLPEVELSLSPIGPSFTDKSSLVFAGRERDNEFMQPTNWAGLYWLDISHDDSSKGSLVLLLPAWFNWTLLALVVAAAAGWYVWQRRRQTYRLR